MMVRGLKALSPPPLLEGRIGAAPAHLRCRPGEEIFWRGLRLPGIPTLIIDCVDENN